MVAFVDDYLPVVTNAVVHNTVANEALNDGHIEQTGRCLSATADSTNRLCRYVQEGSETLDPYFTFSTADLVEGHHLQLTNADGSRTFAAIYMHENRLSILEGTVAARAPAPGLFQQSLQFLDKDGNRIRYQTVYSNGFPPPPHIVYR